MNVDFGAFCDEFYISVRLFLKLGIAPERETLLHFFERLRKQYPGLRKLRRRDDDSLILEEESDDAGSRRWFRLDPDSLRFGHYMPTDLADVRRFADFVLSQAPHHLTLSEIDFDHMEVVYGFDLMYRGNHDQIVAETLMPGHLDSGVIAGDEAAHIVDAQPSIGIALTPQCDVQAYFEVKSRTSTYEVRTGQFEPQPISVLLTVRKYWGVDTPPSLEHGCAMLFDKADALAADRAVPHFVNPLAAAIASRP
jgi:hypothetical protein